MSSSAGRRTRMSLGGAGLAPGASTASAPSGTPLADASSRANRRSRLSLGGGLLKAAEGSTTPSKSGGSSKAKLDRRALLEEWRRNRENTNTNCNAGDTANEDASSTARKNGDDDSSASPQPEPQPQHQQQNQVSPPKRQKLERIDAPPLPPPPLPPVPILRSSGNVIGSCSESEYSENEEQGLSALEKYRLRKKKEKERQQLQGGDYDTIGGPAGTPSRPAGLLPPHPPSSSTNGGASAYRSTLPCFADYDDDEQTTISGPRTTTPSKRGGASPSRSRRPRLSTGGPARRKSLKPPPSSAKAPPPTPPPLARRSGRRRTMGVPIDNGSTNDNAGGLPGGAAVGVAVGAGPGASARSRRRSGRAPLLPPSVPSSATAVASAAAANAHVAPLAPALGAPRAEDGAVAVTTNAVGRGGETNGGASDPSATEVALEEHFFPNKEDHGPAPPAPAVAFDVGCKEAAPGGSDVGDGDGSAAENHVEGAAMRSRITAMQLRIDRLEREKLELGMSKAPLEARFRQKEDGWTRERERLVSEIEGLEKCQTDADVKCREMEMRADALGEEASRLRLENREANSTANGGGNISPNGARAGGNSTGNDGHGDSSNPRTTNEWTERLRHNKEVAQLRDDLRSRSEEIKSQRLEKLSLESEVFGCQKEIETLMRTYDELERDYEEIESSRSSNREAEIQLRVLTDEHTAMTAQLNATSADLAETKSRAMGDARAKTEDWNKREKELLFEISVLKKRGDDGGDRSSEKKKKTNDGEESDDHAVLKARIEERDRKIADLETHAIKSEKLRRAMHNRIQELRGNIRVYVRTRPFLPGDGGRSVSSPRSSIEILPDGESLSIRDGGAGGRASEAHEFKFDRVFAPSSGQDTVFEEVSEFVQSALDGYHVCLFSYGQTGSGKTHTMQGSGNGAMRGIIPRAVEQILGQVEAMRNQRWKFEIRASFLEIYNEELRDLLVSMDPDDGTTTTSSSSSKATTRSASAASSSSNGPKKLSIKRNAAGKSYVDGLNSVSIDTADSVRGLTQLEAVMSAAARARSVAATKMNAQSSRGHSVFMLHLRGSNDESGAVVRGALNLCDLAGSERLDRSGAASDARRLRETQSINKSLSCLGDVFAALAGGSRHVPYRNSKLTYLLQDCLSGDGKALMFVNLSPTVESGNESLCSLRFAKRVNQIELGRATKHVEYGTRR